MAWAPSGPGTPAGQPYSMCEPCSRASFRKDLAHLHPAPSSSCYWAWTRRQGDLTPTPKGGVDRTSSGLPLQGVCTQALESAQTGAQQSRPRAGADGLGVLAARVSMPTPTPGPHSPILPDSPLLKPHFGERKTEAYGDLT